METLTEMLLSRGHANRFITPRIVELLTGGSDSRRWGLVHRAMEGGGVIRLRRGLYILSPELSGREISRFCIANRLVSGSYVSLETSLFFHGWLQEEPTLTQSCLAGGKSRSFSNPLGEFTFEPVPVRPENLLAGVTRLKLQGLPSLVAMPERALGDIAHSRRLTWEGIIGLCHRLRTDMENLQDLDTELLRELSGIYRSPGTRRFLSGLLEALTGDP